MEKGGFAARHQYDIQSRSPVALAVADLNADGRADVVTANDTSSGNISVLLGNGDGTLSYDWNSNNFETDPYALFLAGADVYLRECWRQRETAKLFLSGDGPPRFELRRRESTQWWTRQNSILLKTEPRPVDYAFVVVLTTTTGEIAREIVYARTARAARDLREAALKILTQLCALHARGHLDPAATT